MFLTLVELNETLMKLEYGAKQMVTVSQTWYLRKESFVINVTLTVLARDANATRPHSLLYLVKRKTLNLEFP